jgi:hypothetical protein
MNLNAEMMKKRWILECKAWYLDEKASFMQFCRMVVSSLFHKKTMFVLPWMLSGINRVEGRINKGWILVEKASYLDEKGLFYAIRRICMSNIILDIHTLRNGCFLQGVIRLRVMATPLERLKVSVRI